MKGTEKPMVFPVLRIWGFSFYDSGCRPLLATVLGKYCSKKYSVNSYLWRILYKYFGDVDCRNLSEWTLLENGINSMTVVFNGFGAENT